jgi:hypothetical protein
MCANHWHGGDCAETTDFVSSGVGKLLYVCGFSRPEVCNSVRELSRFSSEATVEHEGQMFQTMKYLVGTPNRGVVMKPDRSWDGGDRDFKFRISGKSDSTYSTDPDGRRSVSSCAVFLEGACISARSVGQARVTLSVTDSELSAAVETAQDMLNAKKILESIGLQVELPIVLWVDNKGARDVTNNWSSRGRMRHQQRRSSSLGWWWPGKRGDVCESQPVSSVVLLLIILFSLPFIRIQGMSTMRDVGGGLLSFIGLSYACCCYY